LAHISRGKIISGRRFLLTGMKSVRKNHLWKRVFAHRDEISGEKSSLEEGFSSQG